MLITIDGIDGVGKTYIAELLTKRLKGTVIKGVRDTHIDKIALNSNFLEVRFLYYMASFLDSVLHAKQALEATIIFDKSHYSTIAYHMSLGAKLSLEDSGIFQLIIPNVKIYLTCEKHIWQQRLKKRKKLDWYEQQLLLDPSLPERIESHYAAMGLTPIENRNSQQTVSEILSLVAYTDHGRKDRDL